VTLVVIHPWASHLEVYWAARFVRFMQRLSRDLHVVHLDKRGMGMSDRIMGAPDVGLLMEVVRAVMDAAVERAAVFGWGGTGGAPLAALFAATYPERTIALILDGAPHQRQDADCPGAPSRGGRGVHRRRGNLGDDDHAVSAQWCVHDRPEDCPSRTAIPALVDKDVALFGDAEQHGRVLAHVGSDSSATPGDDSRS
jgi:pimeloyl-ACP methyl ester carboxylesterase